MRRTDPPRRALLQALAVLAGASGSMAGCAGARPTGALKAGSITTAPIAAAPVRAAAAAADSAAPGVARPSGDDLPFTFGFIGDTPYSWLDQRALDGVLKSLGEEDLAFVLHVGDLKSSADLCTDGLLTARLAQIDQCRHPLILTPGDNDWTDCGDPHDATGPGSALERLDWLRRRIYARPRTLGQRQIAVQQQGPLGSEDAPALPENLRWRIGSLQFCTLHVVGSNNASRATPALERAWLLRQQANAAWLAQTVARATSDQARGLVIAMHANMRFERDRPDGWTMMRELVIAAAVAFPGPVLLLHGDTHWFRSGRLLPARAGLANLYRVECHGSPFTSSWVSIRWNPDRASASDKSTDRTSPLSSGPFDVIARTT